MDRSHLPVLVLGAVLLIGTLAYALLVAQQILLWVLGVGVLGILYAIWRIIVALERIATALERIAERDERD